MATSFGAASGALFNQGVANGLQARRQREARKEFERTRPQRDAEMEIELRRRKAVAENLEADIQIRKAEAANYVEAEKAFELYTGALDQIDWGSPDAAKSYATVTRQYLPTVLKHEATARKWNALDQVTKRGQAFTLQKVDEANIIAAVQEAASEGIIDIPRDAATGEPDRGALQELIDARRREKYDQAIRLRATPYGRPSAAAASGKSAPMSPGMKAKLDAEADSLRKVNEALMAPRLTPEAKQSLLAEKGRILKNIDRLDRMAAVETAPAADAGTDSPPMTAEAAPRGGPSAPAAPAAPGSENAGPIEGYGVFEMDGYQIRFKNE